MSDPTRTGKMMIWQGGGTRGYLSALMSEYMNNRLGIPQDKMYEHVDVMGGTSTGALQAACYAFGLTPAIAQQIYLDISKRLFTSRDIPVGCDALLDSNKLNIAQKVALILLNEPFYQSPCPIGEGDSNYGDNILQTTLIDTFGDSTMQDLLTSVVIPSYEESNKKFSYFSNNTTPFFIGQNHKIRDVLRASSAAPLYLPAWDINAAIYGDGGIFDNNPIPMAERCLKTLKPRLNRLLIIAYGTGLGSYGFEGTPSGDVETSITRLSSLFDISSTGSQESSTKMYQFDMNYTTDETHIYNFQPVLDPNIDTELDTSTPALFAYLQSVFDQHIIDNIAEIDDFVVRWNL